MKQPLRHITASAFVLLVCGCVTTGNDPDALEQDLTTVRQKLNQGEDVSTSPLLQIIEAETSPPLLKARAAYLIARKLAQEEALSRSLEMATRSLELYQQAKGTVPITWYEFSMPLDIALMLKSKLSGPESTLPLSEKYGRPIDRNTIDAWSRKPSGVIVHNPTKIAVPVAVGDMTLLQKTIYKDEPDSFNVYYSAYDGIVSVEYFPTGDGPLKDYAHHELLAQSLSTLTQSPPILRRIRGGEIHGVGFPGFLVDKETRTGRSEFPGHAGTLILDIGTHTLCLHYALIDRDEDQQGTYLDILAAIVSAIRWPNERSG